MNKNKLYSINLNKKLDKHKVALHKVLKNITIIKMIKLNSLPSLSYIIPYALSLYTNIRYFSASLIRYTNES